MGRKEGEKLKSLRTYIIDCLEHENRAFKKKMLKNKKALKDPQTQDFTVEVSHHIDIIDPVPVFCGKSEKLEDAFKEAHDKFMEKHREETNILIYKVSVTLKGGIILNVPREYWEKIRMECKMKFLSAKRILDFLILCGILMIKERG